MNSFVVSHTVFIPIYHFTLSMTTTDAILRWSKSSSAEMNRHGARHFCAFCFSPTKPTPLNVTRSSVVAAVFFLLFFSVFTRADLRCSNVRSWQIKRFIQTRYEMDTEWRGLSCFPISFSRLLTLFITLTCVTLEGHNAPSRQWGAKYFNNGLSALNAI